jgi:hypothetical protein
MMIDSPSRPPLNLTVIRLSMYFPKSRIFSFFGRSAWPAAAPAPPCAPPRPPPPPPRPPRSPRLRPPRKAARSDDMVVLWESEWWRGWRRIDGCLRQERALPQVYGPCPRSICHMTEGHALGLGRCLGVEIFISAAASYLKSRASASHPAAALHLHPPNLPVTGETAQLLFLTLVRRL